MGAGIEEITAFTRDCLARNIARADVEQVLLQAGWPSSQVRTALAAFADVDFPIPVPAPRPARHFSAGEAFAYLVLFAALGASSASLVQLSFRIIEASFPDPSSIYEISRTYWGTQVRWSVARIIIFFPVFLFASYRINRYFQADQTRRDSPTRRWVTYAAMFINVCVIGGDLVTLVAYLLAGETTVQFLLKVLAVAVVAGSILGYYLQDLRRGERRN